MKFYYELAFDSGYIVLPGSMSFDDAVAVAEVLYGQTYGIWFDDGSAAFNLRIVTEDVNPKHVGRFFDHGDF